jgi:hypothetical protein
MIRARIIEFLKMCRHRNCWEIFVSSRTIGLFGSWRLCDKHKDHATFNDLECQNLHD